MTKHQYEDLIQVFNETFYSDYNTQLVKGDDEPIYTPASEEVPYHQIIFAHGYFASAIHEISHWCVAGRERRGVVDYGYWYCPDGRDKETQHQFQVVEIRPQALDWLFCLATDYPFNVSCDNLDGDFEPDREAFKADVREEVSKMLETDDIPERAKVLLAKLNSFYGTQKMDKATFEALS